MRRGAEGGQSTERSGHSQGDTEQPPSQRTRGQGGLCRALSAPRRSLLLLGPGPRRSSRQPQGRARARDQVGDEWRLVAAHSGTAAFPARPPTSRGRPQLPGRGLSRCGDRAKPSRHPPTTRAGPHAPPVPASPLVLRRGAQTGSRGSPTEDALLRRTQEGARGSSPSTPSSASARLPSPEGPTRSPAPSLFSPLSSRGPGLEGSARPGRQSGLARVPAPAAQRPPENTRVRHLSVCCIHTCA